MAPWWLPCTDQSAVPPASAVEKSKPAASDSDGVPYGWPVRSCAPDEVSTFFCDLYFWSIHSPFAKKRSGAAACHETSPSRPSASTSLTVML